MALLRVENITKIYGKDMSEVKALNNVSFSVEKGEFIAIIGQSGSGKSTLMHIIGGVDQPTSGSIFLNDIDITKLNEKKLAKYRRKYVGLIYQFYNLIPILNVRENILLPIALDHNKADNQYFEILTETLGIQDRLLHLPNELSGGQQQRVAIARALIAKPALLLADEPTGNLDSKTSDDILKLLKVANKKLGQTVIVITHDLELATHADRIITIKDGQIVSDTKQKEYEDAISFNN